MKSITEFANYILDQGLKAKTALAAEGKTAEEVLASLGEKFKYEGDKLKHFASALEVATVNAGTKLKRVVVMSLNEGEKAPAKSTEVEGHHYVPEFFAEPKPAAAADHKGGGKGRGGPGGRPGGKGAGPKESPWGLSPEQKAAKKGKQTPKA